MFNKIWNWIKTIGVNLAGNAAITQVEQLLDKGLEEFIVSDPVKCKGMVVGLHAFIPTLAALAAKTTGTDMDDKAVEATRKEFEDFAARHGIILTDIGTLGTTVGDAANLEP